MRVGMNGVYRMSPGANEIPAGVRAVWTDEQTLVAEYDAISSIDAFDMMFRFDGDHVNLHTKERTYEAGLTLIGISDTVRK
jgi:hypothetical protein